MEERKTVNTIRSKINEVILMIVAFLLFVSFFEVIRLGQYVDDSVAIEGPFDVEFNGQLSENVELAKNQFPSIKKGDHVSYSFVLHQTDISNAVLTLYLDHVAVKVYFDDELVYEKGNENSRMMGYGYTNIQLPDEYEGIKVKVDLYAIENEGLSSLTPPSIQNARTQIRNLIDQSRIYLVIDIAIIVLCGTIVFLSFFLSRVMPSLRHLVYLGMAFFLMGLYEICSHNLIWIFTDSLVARGYMEFLTLYIGPFFLSLYFYKEFFENESERARKIYRVIVSIQAVFPVLAIILHFTDVIHLPGLLSVYHVILLINVIAILIILIRSFLRKENEHRYMIIGLIIVIVLAIDDVVRFNLYIRFLRGSITGYVSYLLIGFFLFLIAMVIDFFINQRKKLYKIARDEAIAKLAYEDIMTGLKNRRGCDKVFEEIRKDKLDFGIICIDINFLKLANDRYGHPEGDRLITDFADLLKEATDGLDCTIGRMGGDEFIVITKYADASRIKAIVDAITNKRDEINADRKPMTISFAYGSCSSVESEVTENVGDGDIVEMVYHVADERMYEQKVAMKARREDL